MFPTGALCGASVPSKCCLRANKGQIQGCGPERKVKRPNGTEIRLHTLSLCGGNLNCPKVWKSLWKLPVFWVFGSLGEKHL